MADFVFNKKLIIKKYPGKGGWHYVEIENFSPSKNNPFGWVQVCGNISGYTLSRYKLMPMGNGKLFLPIKAEIRKKLKLEEGSEVTVQLNYDNSALVIPEEFSLCLLQDPGAEHFFHSLTDSAQQHFLDWIYSAKQEKTKESRLIKALTMLSEGKKMYSE